MKRARISRYVITAVCIIVGLIVLIPFLMMLLNSFKNIRESALFRLSLPSQWVLSNYLTVLSKSHLARGFFNSFVICFSTVIIDNLFAAMAAFVIQRNNSLFNRISFLFIFAGLIVPIAIIPTIRLMMQLHVHNTYLGIVLYYTATVMPFSVFVLTGFMKSVPRELDESALIEGCSYFRMFIQVILPLLITSLITVTIVVTVSVWNDFFGPFYLISDSRKWTVILNIYGFISLYQTNWGVVFAFMVLAITPVLVIYFALQRYVIDGLTAGSLKG